MKNVKLDRRLFIKSVAGQYLFLPLLPSVFYPLHSRATGVVPKRVIFIQMRDGTFESEYWPTNAAANTGVLDAANNVYGTRLSNIPGRISNVYGPEFDTLRNKFSLVRGLGYLHYAFHKACAPFSGAETLTSSEGSGPRFGSSIDSIIEHSAQFSSSTMPILPIRIASVHRSFSWWRPDGGNSANLIKKAVISGDTTVFNSVFSNYQPPSQTVIPPSKRPTLIDALRTEFNALKSNSKLSAEDKLRLEHHQDNLHELQKRIIASQPSTDMDTSCVVPTITPGSSAVVARKRYENYFDTIASAFSCDMTRMATVFLSNFDDPGQIGSDLHHDNSHGSSTNATVLANCARWQGWAMDRVAYLMKKLDSIPQPDGTTLLDNTLIVVANEDGYGASHSSEGLQLMVAGNSEHINMGYYIDYRKRPLVDGAARGFNPQVGLPWPGALISIMKAMGVQESEYLRQGDNSLFATAQYQFPNKYTNPNNYRRNPLPFLYKA